MRSVEQQTTMQDLGDDVRSDWATKIKRKKKALPRTSPHWCSRESSSSRLARYPPIISTLVRKPGLAISCMTAHPTAVAKAFAIEGAALVATIETTDILMRD